MNKKLYFFYYIFLAFPFLISLTELSRYMNQLFKSGFSFLAIFPILFVGFISLCVFLGYKSRVRDIIQTEKKIEKANKRIQVEKKYMYFTNITIFILIFHPEKTSNIIYFWLGLLILSIILLQINYYFEKKLK